MIQLQQMNNVMRYTRRLFQIAALVLSGLFFVSCIYDHYEDEEMQETPPFSEGFSLNLRLSLDNMGGTRANNTSKLAEFENYIDPEKCRVLFFDYNDRFIFESKSRWVKQLAPTGDGEQWMVSIPMYAYGNDVKENWDWEEIRNLLMGKGEYGDECQKAYEDRVKKARDAGKSETEIAKITPYTFKIAVLVNRPAMEVYPDLETEDKDGGIRQASTFENSGPHWTTADTRFKSASPKTLMDLHHTQPDPIYRDKGYPTRTSNNVTYKWRDTGFDNFYAFVMGEENGELTMSSTSSWVDYGTNNGDDSPRKKKEGNSERRAARTADTNYPIPMYGLQAFNRIENWVEGVPFNLSTFVEGSDDSEEDSRYQHKSIALLRSVVKLELVIPKTFTNGTALTVDYLALAYSNIYARCEPMDTWTPTDELWKEGHDESKECEWFTLKKYSRMVESGRSAAAATTGTLESNQGTISNSNNDLYNFNAYRRRLSWFYGAWLDVDWPFSGLRENNNGTGAQDKAVVQAIVDERRAKGDEPPRIFNPCIQRNLRVLVDDNNLYTGYADDAQNYHYVVYTGERNGIDPNVLYAADNLSNIAPTICFWMIGISRGNTKYEYGFPITKYEETANAARSINTLANLATYTGDFPSGNPNVMGSTYPGEMVSSSTTNYDLLPWPLMRNHHYTVKIGGITRAAGDDGLEFMVSSEENHSESLLPVR